MIVIALTAQAALAQKDLVIKTARALETAPLDKETLKMREKAIRWIIETDEVSVTVCGGVFSMFSDKKNKNSSEMTAAYTVGLASFRLENPAKASDENATQLSALELALKVYEALVADKPKTKNETVELLLEKRNKGELGTAVTALNCGGK